MPRSSAACRHARTIFVSFAVIFTRSLGVTQPRGGLGNRRPLVHEDKRVVQRVRHSGIRCEYDLIWFKVHKEYEMGSFWEGGGARRCASPRNHLLPTESQGSSEPRPTQLTVLVGWGARVVRPAGADRTVRAPLGMDYEAGFGLNGPCPTASHSFQCGIAAMPKIQFRRQARIDTTQLARERPTEPLPACLT